MTAIARSPATSAEPAAARGGSVGVLVVDDSVVFRTGMTRAVQACHGLELLGEAGDGETALRLIDELEPDLMILDLRMPALDGLGVLERLRASRRRGSCRVLVISATLDDVVEAELIAAGADACLSKALSRAEICSAALRLAGR
jgi:DNA-binding NarL/FixJ family response regulator